MDLKTIKQIQIKSKKRYSAEELDLRNAQQ